MNWNMHIIMTMFFILGGAFLVMNAGILNLGDYSVLLALFVVFAALGSLLPDIDHKDSKITRIVHSVSLIIALGAALIFGGTLAEKAVLFGILFIVVGIAMWFFRFIFPHRGFVHSLTFGVGVSAVLAIVLYIFGEGVGITEAFVIFVGTLAGYESHLICDGYIIPKLI